MGGLRRELGFWEATTITVGSMIGSGVFYAPNLVAREFADPGVILSLWAVGGLFSLAGALTVAELSTMYPRSGGLYHFLREAFGDAVSFFSAWGYFFLAKAAIGAAVAFVFAIHVSYFFPLTDLGVKLLAAWALAAVTFVNYLGVLLTGRVQNVLTLLKALSLALIVAAAAVLAPSSPSAGPSPVEAGGRLSAAFVAILFAYNAWINVTLVAGEVRDPSRNLPRALASGVGLVIILYLAANWAYLRVLSADGVAASGLVATDAASRLFASGGAFVAGAVLVSTFGNLNGGVLTGARIPFALAEDGWLPRGIASVSRFATPAPALVLHLVVSTSLLAMGGFQEIITYAVFVVWATLFFVALALFRLRRTRPEADRPYRVVGYPWTPALFAAAAGFVVLQTLVEQPREAAIGAAIVATGVPVYFWRRSRTANP
ncbi:MAG: APC family permease [Methanobacteriota archaeon]